MDDVFFPDKHRISRNLWTEGDRYFLFRGMTAAASYFLKIDSYIHELLAAFNLCFVSFEILNTKAKKVAWNYSGIWLQVDLRNCQVW